MMPEQKYEPEARVLSLRVTLMGRPVKNYYFDKPVITIGRDPASDVFIDNAGVSREHVRLEQYAPGEYEVVDLGSANGTVLNEMPVRCKIPLREGDHLRVGKHTIMVSYADDRRSSVPTTHPTPDVENKTVVLSRVDINRLLDRQRQAETEPPPTPPLGVASPAAAAPDAGVSATGHPVRSGWLVPALVGFVVGAACGAIAMWFVIR
jgi:predicted component of type VI protein secretion system